MNHKGLLETVEPSLVLASAAWLPPEVAEVAAGKMDL